jgi:hypothetical protein
MRFIIFEVRGAYMDLGSIVEVVSSISDRRKYAVVKALWVLEAVSGVGSEKAFADIVGGKLDVYDVLRKFVRSLQGEVWLLKVFRFYLSLLVRMLRMAGSDVKSGLLRYRVPLPAGGLLRRTGR